MDTSQKFPKLEEIKSGSHPSSLDTEPLTQQQQDYVSYVAVGGLLTSDDGKVSKMSLDEFAGSIGVTRRTLHTWKKTIPNFWHLVDGRRSEIFTQNRITAVWNGLFLRAMKGDAEQAKIVLGQYAKWQPPAQKHEVQHELGNTWTSLAQAKIKQEPIEGEVVNATAGNDNDGAVQSAPRVLPEAS